MFDFVRNNTKIMMGLLFLLIIPSFVMFGLEGYSRFNDQGAAVAKVNGNKISQGEWDAAHKREVDRIRSSMPNIDVKMFDTPEAKYATLERLVRDQVVAAAAQKLQLVASDTRLARELQSIPAIAALRSADGKLDMERYKQLVASQGMTPEMFEMQMRSDISNRQVIQGVQSSAFATLAQTQTAMNAFMQRREVQIVNFPASDFLSKVNVNDADIQAYYDKNTAKFQSAESADIEYVVLDIESLRQSIVLNEQDLKTYYEQNLQRLSSKEERRASHILITAAKDAPEAEKKAARAKAEELLKAVKAKPASFAEVARKNSQDPGSAVKGGDLDFFGRGAMVKPFEDAAFGLKKSEISDLVESEFGYHIIQLTDIKAPKAQSFESMRPALEADLKKQQAQRKYAEMAETFSNTVYEQSDSLKPVAEKLKLNVQKASKVLRNAEAPNAQGKNLLSHPGLLQALFSEASLQKQRNTEAVEVAPSTLVSARVVKHQPAATLPLADVKDLVKRSLMQDKAAEMAKAQGEQKVASLKTSADGLPNAVVLSREKNQKQLPQVVDAVLRADPNKLPAVSGVDLGAQGYAVIRVTKVLPPEDNKDLMKQAQQQFTQLWGSAETLAYLAELKALLKTEILVTKPASEKAKTPA
ncbi:SurA N-terminal domain-containing protein [Limnohabitans sp. Rim11]|uniref:SurA N-terminal domain-containing protein n=1 Tax=Limnohabitans sp. Rim11 TaxID=1100719 RepID=UPI000A91BC2E|nr:SurA N-terminal domain-containing protein [Limnohabitans sp. Rim11]